MNPFAVPPSPTEYLSVAEFLTTVAGGQDNADQRGEIESALSILERLPPESRTFDAFTACLPPGDTCDAFRRYSQGSTYDHLFRNPAANRPLLTATRLELTTLATFMLEAGLPVATIKQYLHSIAESIVDGAAADFFSAGDDTPVP